MTTICACDFESQRYIGADSTISLGNMIPKNIISPNSKIYDCGNSLIGILGSLSVGHKLDKYVSLKKIKLDRMNEQNLESLFEDFFIYLKEKYSFLPDCEQSGDFEAWDLEFLIVNLEGLFSVHARREVFRHERFFALGSGAEYALGAMSERLFHQECDALQVVQSGLRAAANFDAFSNPPFDIRKLNLV